MCVSVCEYNSTAVRPCVVSQAYSCTRLMCVLCGVRLISDDCACARGAQEKNVDCCAQMREISQILEQMREIFQQEQICKILDPQKSILELVRIQEFDTTNPWCVYR